MRTQLPFTLALALAACAGAPADDLDETDVGDTDETDVGDTDETDAGDTDETDVADDTDPGAPSVVSMSPVDGATAVLPDTPIIVTFSRAMDTASVEAALEVTGLTDGFDTQWNDDGTVLTVVPEGGLPVRPNRAGIAGAEVGVRIDATAVDAAGAALDAAGESVFRVVRRTVWKPDLDLALTGRVSSDGQTSTASLWVGDNEARVVHHTLVSFVVDDAPAHVAIDSATLTVGTGAVVGTPWAAMDLEVGRVSFDAVASDAFGITGLGAPMAVDELDANAESELGVAELLAPVLADTDSADGRLQLRFAFDDGTDGDSASDYVVVVKDSLALEVALFIE